MSIKEYNELNNKITEIYISICLPCMARSFFIKGKCKRCKTMEVYIELQEKKRTLLILLMFEDPEEVHSEFWDNLTAKLMKEKYELKEEKEMSEKKCLLDKPHPASVTWENKAMIRCNCPKHINIKCFEDFIRGNNYE